MLRCRLAGYAPACFCTSAQAQLSWWAAYRAPPHSRHACLLTAQPCFPQSVVVILSHTGKLESSPLTEDLFKIFQGRFQIALATSVSVTLLRAFVKKGISAEVFGAAEECWIHEHLRYLYSQGLATLSSMTSFPNVLQAGQGGLLSAGKEEASSALGISAGPCHLQLEGH